MMPDIATLYSVMEHTWPAVSLHKAGAWTLRNGGGGGKRVSAATAAPGMTTDAIPKAEQAMRTAGQTPLFMLREGEDDLDQALDARGYEIIDPVNIYLSEVRGLTGIAPPRTATFNIWPPLAIQQDIWAQGGIGPARIAVMERAKGPKTALFGREDNRPAATGFAAMHQRIAMVHALEVLPRHRRKGMGRHLMAEAGHWAAAQNATHISVICTQANTAACALYSSLGMALAGQYHYRILREGPAS